MFFSWQCVFSQEPTRLNFVQGRQLPSWQQRNRVDTDALGRASQEANRKTFVWLVVVPFSPLVWGGEFATKIDYREKKNDGTLIRSSLLEDPEASGRSLSSSCKQQAELFAAIWESMPSACGVARSLFPALSLPFAEMKLVCSCPPAGFKGNLLHH